jgi:twinkle protein
MLLHASALGDKFRDLRTGKKSRLALSTGFIELDKCFKPAKNYFAVVTGYPGSGKSEFVDALLVNMSLMHGWKSLYFSPENNPLEEHMAKLAEKFVGKQIKKFTVEEMQKSLEFVDNHFAWIDIDNPDLESILDIARERKRAGQLDCLVIDPWNSIIHKRGMLREDEYLMESLSRVLVFARRSNIFLIILAHPKTIAPDKERKIPVPTVAEISGGAMWWNKVDYAIVCHRPHRGKHILDVHLQKLKQKWMGNYGTVRLDYEPESGRFKDSTMEEFYLPTDIVAPF